MPKYILIVAHDLNRGIGKDNKLLYQKQNRDMLNFKDVTTGNVVVMGRKTFESLNNKPLPNRKNFILSSTLQKGKQNGYEVFNNIEELTNFCSGEEKVFIIGGENVYKQFLPLADEIMVTLIHTTKEADTFFPEFDKSEWLSINKGLFRADMLNEFPYTFKHYFKKYKK